MTATEELRSLLDERGVEYVTADGKGIWGTSWGYKIAFVELDSGTIHFEFDTNCITPEQAVEATLGRGECRFLWSLADNGWADHTCSACGYVENTDVHVSLDWKYCPNCGRKVVAE